MSAVSLAISAILSLFLAAWMLLVIHDPKRWRLWWLDLFGVVDVETTREERREQESRICVLAYTLCFLLVIMAVSCCFWSFDVIQNSRRPKSALEREMEFARQYVSGSRR